jgi:uncharacterized membrane protein YeaQ/YmgE (transglycosylase-associated protein family)
MLPAAEEKKNMVANLMCFALIGVIVGGAARVFYPGRHPMRILGTVVLGMVGSLVGGLVGWACFPAPDGQLTIGTLLMALLGAVLVLVFWAGGTYARSIGGSR